MKEKVKKIVIRHPLEKEKQISSPKLIPNLVKKGETVLSDRRIPYYMDRRRRIRRPRVVQKPYSQEFSFVDPKNPRLRAIKLPHQDRYAIVDKEKENLAPVKLARGGYALVERKRPDLRQVQQRVPRSDRYIRPRIRAIPQQNVVTHIHEPITRMPMPQPLVTKIRPRLQGVNVPLKQYKEIYVEGKKQLVPVSFVSRRRPRVAVVKTQRSNQQYRPIRRPMRVVRRTPVVRRTINDKPLANKFELEIFEAQNRLRTDPRSFEPILRRQVKNFRGKLLRRGKRNALYTKEGSSAWKEAIQALNHQSLDLDPLRWDNGLYLAARDHCHDIGARGDASHTGTDGTEVWHRLNRYGSGSRFQGENLSFGEHESGKQYMLALYIDDGVMDRGHRNALQNPNYKRTGIAVCKHNSHYKVMVSIAYADRFELNELGKTMITKSR